MPVVIFRKDIQMKMDIIGFVLNVLKTLKTCCSASSTVHCHRQAKTEQPRSGWAEAFSAMHENKEDVLEEIPDSEI